MVNNTFFQQLHVKIQTLDKLTLFLLSKVAVNYVFVRWMGHGFSTTNLSLSVDLSTMVNLYKLRNTFVRKRLCDYRCGL